VAYKSCSMVIYSTTSPTRDHRPVRPRRCLIVNADDFGLTDGVTRGIHQAHRQGLVTSTTVMATGPAFDAAVHSLRRTPRLATGVHLVLTAGRPLSAPTDIPELCDGDGRFRRRLPDLTRPGTAEQVLAEWSAQVEKFLNAGLRPTHVDSHHYVHQHAGLAPLCLELCRRFGIRAVRCLRPADLDVAGNPLDPAGVLTPDNLAQSRDLFAAGGLACPDQTRGIAPKGRPLTPVQLDQWLAALPPGFTELVCHPGLIDPALEAASSLLIERERELHTLCHPRARRAIRCGAIRTATFADIPAPAGAANDCP